MTDTYAETTHSSRSSTTTWDRRRLRIYLSDHRGGASGGLALAQRCAARNQGTALGEEMTAIAAEIAADVEALDRAAAALGVRTSPIKRALGALAERVARLKPNGQLRGYSPLSRLIELEGLFAGIDAKRLLWRALAATGHADDLRAVGIDPDALALRAEDQRDRLVSHHREAARWALVDRMAVRAIDEHAVHAIAESGSEQEHGGGPGHQRGLP